MPTTFEASAVMEYGFAGGPTGRNQFQHVAASADYGFDVIPTAGRLREFSALVSIEYGFESVVTGDNSSRATTLTARDVIGDVFKLWGLCCDNANDFDPCIRTEALQAVNAALQFIHANGKALPYLTRRQRDYWLDSGTTYVQLEDDVQHIEGAARKVGHTVFSMPVSATTGGSDGRPESPLNATGPGFIISTATGGVLTVAGGQSVAELQEALNAASLFNEVHVSYDYDGIGSGDGLYTLRIYFGGPDYAWLYVDGGGVAQLSEYSVLQIEVGLDFWTEIIDTTNAATDDPMAPLASGYEARHYAALYGVDAPLSYWLDRQQKTTEESSKTLLWVVPAVSSPTCVRLDVGIQAQRLEWNDFLNRTEVPIPHQYVESLLIPIARWYASASRSYKQKERHAVLIEQYQQALAMLGMVDPKPAGKPAKDGGSEE